MTSNSENIFSDVANILEEHRYPFSQVLCGQSRKKDLSVTRPMTEWPILCMILGDLSITESTQFLGQTECFCTSEGFIRLFAQGITKKKLERFANKMGDSNFYFVKYRDTPNIFFDEDVLIFPMVFGFYANRDGVMHTSPWDVDGDVTSVIFQTNKEAVGSGYRREIEFRNTYFRIDNLWWDKKDDSNHILRHPSDIIFGPSMATLDRDVKKDKKS